MTCAVSPFQKLFQLADKKFIPLNMMLELTYRCNESCLHCYLPETQGARPARRRDELSTDEWGRVLEELARAGCLYLILSGGEVLLREDFEKILRRARELHFSVEIFTNATLLTEAVADSWAALDVQTVAVSCYSPDAVWHDRVTRLKGSFEKTTRGVKLLRERGIPVKLKCPMMKLNMNSYKALIALAGELGAEYQFDPMMVPRNDGGENPLRLGIRDDQLREVYRDSSLIPNGDAILEAAVMDPALPTCSAGRTSGAIGPYGDVYPCIQWQAVAGNVRTSSFAAIWRDAGVLRRARTYTGADVKPCPDCGKPHYIHCLGLSELEHGDPLVPDGGACRLTKAIQQIQTEAKEKTQ